MANLTTTNSSLPAHLQGKVKEHRVGNIDQSDLIIPRIKLLQATSPEVTEFNHARAGEFWHTILNENLGKELRGVPIIMRKTQVLWAPRGDDRGILARARDAIHWDPPQGEFQVKFKNNPNTYTWRLAPTVAESKLDQFGTSRNDDPKSPPAAALTYEFLWMFPDLPDMGPAIILNTRGSIKIAQRLISLIDAKPVDHFNQQYIIGSVVDKGPTNETFFNYSYRGDGYADEKTCQTAEAWFTHYKDSRFQASDEGEDSPDAAGPIGESPVHGKTERSSNTKF